MQRFSLKLIIAAIYLHAELNEQYNSARKQNLMQYTTLKKNL